MLIKTFQDLETIVDKFLDNIKIENAKVEITLSIKKEDWEEYKTNMDNYLDSQILPMLVRKTIEPKPMSTFIHRSGLKINIKSEKQND